MIRLVAQVLHHGKLLRAHLCGDLFQHLGPGHLPGQFGDDDVAVLHLVAGAQLQPAGSLAVDGGDVRPRRNQLPTGGEIRSLDVPHELAGCGLRLFEQADHGGGHLAQVVRRHVGGHAHGDAACAVQQQVGQPGRQQGRLPERAVEVRRPVHRSLIQLRKQDLRVACQPGLGVSHGRKRLGVVLRAPVALPVDDRVPAGERLRHVHHGLVAGRVAVRMKLADDIAHRPRRLLGFGRRRHAEIAHGIDDPALHGLEPVADVRQRPVQHNVHGVVQVRLLGELRQRDPFDPLEIQFLFMHRVIPKMSDLNEIQPGKSATAQVRCEGARGYPLQASCARRGAMDGQERRAPI